MNNDKIISRALQQNKSHLSVGFNQDLMAKVMAQAIRREKQKMWLGYAVAGIVSALLIAFSVFLFMGKVSVPAPPNISSNLNFDFESPLLKFSIFISSIMLFLLFIDGIIRNLRQKHQNQQ